MGIRDEQGTRLRKHGRRFDPFKRLTARGWSFRPSDRKRFLRRMMWIVEEFDKQECIKAYHFTKAVDALLEMSRQSILIEQIKVSASVNLLKTARKSEAMQQFSLEEFVAYLEAKREQVGGPAYAEQFTEVQVKKLQDHYDVPADELRKQDFSYFTAEGDPDDDEEIVEPTPDAGT